MKKVHWGVFTVVILLGLLITLSRWKLTAQEQAPSPQTQSGMTEEFAPNIEEESDAELVKMMDLLEDSELLEMLISDPDFLDVLEEFADDLGIGEEEVPYELLEESEFSKLISGLEKPGKTIEMERCSAGTGFVKEEGR